MPWIGMLEKWQIALSKRLGRSAEDIVENNLLATDFQLTVFTSNFRMAPI